ncbi:glutamate--cysteine ligase [Isoalcanivorax beigongshangi]|uniref:Glutamate--cysteine ligase n=1 Tax=Isoalcanivorax beigongshangi TaxID=3238810 RepID=A0ABV4AEP0_9GAMM
MTDVLFQRLNALQNQAGAATLTGIQRGIEKESLRISPDGHIALTPHPQALGSALTHPHLTTDYSEALLEFITPPSSDPAAPIEFLEQLHRFVYQNIDDELLWVNSMPCVLGEDDSIPLADYGSSNSGMMKHIYRRGLGHRYGRRMQTIAGIHYNMSFPQELWQLHQDAEGDRRPLGDFISARYMDLTRNFQRYSWLLIYLFGASPAVCASFLSSREHSLQPLLKGTLARPAATSLRMSDLGYQNNAQSALHISYNSLDDYVETLTQAIRTPAPEYQRIGVKVDGEYRQLNANILQIENEYYSSIRPKRTVASGERPTQALAQRGVEYVEIRALDLNPFEPVGINKEQMRFLDLFATFCLMHSAPVMCSNNLSGCKDNIRQVVYEGRDTGILLRNLGRDVSLHDWALSVLEHMEPIAELFDAAYDTQGYRRALDAQREKVLQPELTPSAILMDKLVSRRQSFFEFAMNQAEAHRDHFRAMPRDAERDAQLVALAQQSLQQQLEQERNDSQSFEDFLAAYFRD